MSIGTYIWSLVTDYFLKGESAENFVTHLFFGGLGSVTMSVFAEADFDLWLLRSVYFVTIALGIIKGYFIIKNGKSKTNEDNEVSS